MALIKLSKNRRIEVTKEVAEEVGQKWRDPNYKGAITISGKEYRKSEIKEIDHSEARKPVEYNLHDQAQREEVKAFEKDIGAHSFEDYCVLLGLMFSRQSSVLGGRKEYTVNGNRLVELEAARKKFKAVQELRRRRWFAERKHHVTQLAGEECGCELYCNPFKKFRNGKRALVPNGPDIDEELCDRCGELASECKCIKEQELPF